MNWVEDDIQTSLGQSKFIDTAIIPVSRVSWGIQAIEHSNILEYLKKVCIVLEKQYRGRMILFPPILYCEDIELVEITRLLSNQLSNEGTKNIFVITCDTNVKLRNVIHIPKLPIEKMNYENQMILINSQIDEIVKSVSQTWN